MKYFLLALAFSLSFSLHSEVFLECKPIDQKSKNTIEQDLLIVMIRDGFSSYFNDRIEEGIYKYKDLDGKFYKESRGEINQEYIMYYSSIITVNQSVARVYVNRKNLEARVYRSGYYGQDNKRPRLRGMCELTTKDKFYETISSKISEKQSDNVF